MDINLNAKEIHLVATVIRADGTVEELGIIDYYHRNPFKRLMWRLRQWLKNK
jgi:hypothetical protein